MQIFIVFNDTDRMERTTKPDRDIPSFDYFMANLNCLIVTLLKNVNYIIAWRSIKSCIYIQYIYIYVYNILLFLLTIHLRKVYTYHISAV